MRARLVGNLYFPNPLGIVPLCKIYPPIRLNRGVLCRGGSCIRPLVQCRDPLTGGYGIRPYGISFLIACQDLGQVGVGIQNDGLFAAGQALLQSIQSQNELVEVLLVGSVVGLSQHTHVLGFAFGL